MKGPQLPATQSHSKGEAADAAQGQPAERQRAPAAGYSWLARRLPEHGPAVLRKAKGKDSFTAADAAAAPEGAGAALGDAVRGDLEHAFGHDLSTVRVHADPAAARAADAMNARAMTVDRRIYFGAGQYSPATSDGRR